MSTVFDSMDNLRRRYMREAIRDQGRRTDRKEDEAPRNTALTPEPGGSASPWSMGNWNIHNSIFNPVPANLRFNMNGAQNPAPAQGQQSAPVSWPSTPMGPQNSAPQLPGPGPLPDYGPITPGSINGNPFAAKARAIGLSDYQPSTQSMQASALRGGANNG